MASTFDIASQNNVGVLNGYSYDQSISADGNLLAFVSFDSTSGKYQIYAKNESTAALTLVSQSSGGATANTNNYGPAISADGSSVAFASTATDLVSGATGGNEEVYVKNLSSSGLILISQNGATIADGFSADAALSSNGNIVAFESSASNLGLGSTGAFAEVYVKNIPTGVLTLVSQTASHTLANGNSTENSISADGNNVVFTSSATDLGSSSGSAEVYSESVATGALTIVSQTSGGVIANGSSSGGSSSADGSLVAFQSTATNLVTGATSGTEEVYLKDLSTNALTLISTKADGTIANSSSYNPVLSADGHYVMFSSTATNLDPAATNGTQQVYVKNLQTGALSLLSQTSAGVAGNNASYTDNATEQAFSADDSKTTFNTAATNLAGTPVGSNVVLRDTTTGPALVLNPVTSDDVVNATELAAPVTFSGTSDAIGGTVQVSIDTAGNSIGSATVQANGTWSLAATVSGLAQGAHTEIATVQGAPYLTTTTTKPFTVDTTAPTVAFNTPVTFTDAHTATITGTVSDPSSAVTGVQVTVNGTSFAATLNGTDWSLAGVHVGSGFQIISATATDAAGNTSPATPAPFSLETGLKGPFSADEEDFDSMGRLAGETFTKSNGKIYLADTVTNLPNGDQFIDYSAGTFFAKQNYFNKSDLTTPDDHTKVETFYNNDGTHMITGYANGVKIKSIHDDTMTGGGKHETFVFKPHFGQDLITDFIVSGSGHDTLSLSRSEFSSVAQVLNHTQDVNGSAEITVGQHDTITLQNVTTAELKAHQTDIKLHA